MFILQFKLFLGNENCTRHMGEWSMICSCPTLLTLAWASGRVLMSHPVATLDFLQINDQTLILFIPSSCRGNIIILWTIKPDLWWNRELTLKCKLKCYVKPMKDPLGVSPSKGNQGTTQGKENFFWPRWESNPRPKVFTRANAQWVFHGFHIAL